MPLAIETSGLVKHFGDTHAVDGIDLRIEKGTVYGLLGPNGAGKTTTIRVLAPLPPPRGPPPRTCSGPRARAGRPRCASACVSLDNSHRWTRTSPATRTSC